MPPPNFTFHTPLATKLSISRACSTKHNKRNLERLFYVAYISTLQEAVKFSTRLVVSPQPDLSIPGDMVIEHRLWTRRRDLDQRMETFAVELEDIRKYVSTRIQGIHEQGINDKINNLITLYDEWYTELRQLGDARSKREAELDELAGDVSVGGHTCADGEAIENFPDFSIDHIIAGQFSEPTIEDMKPPTTAQGKKEQLDFKTWLEFFKLQRIGRGGIQTIHSCSTLLGELKSSPTRSFEFAKLGDVEELLETLGPDRTAAPGSLFSPGSIDTRFITVKWERTLFKALGQAITQLGRYCSVYFSLQPTAESVIALAGAGPYYQWAEIERDDVPPAPLDSDNILGDGESFDENSGEQVTVAEPLLKKFCGEDPEDLTYYVLGSSGSDEQIAKISESVYRLMHHRTHAHEDGHVPTVLNFTILSDTLQRPQDAIPLSAANRY